MWLCAYTTGQKKSSWIKSQRKTNFLFCFRWKTFFLCHRRVFELSQISSKFLAWILHDHIEEGISFRFWESRHCFNHPWPKSLQFPTSQTHVNFPPANHHEKFIICQLSHLVNNEKFDKHRKHKRCTFS